jgi:hypothetical protein
MIRILKVQALEPIDLGRAGNFKQGENYLARYSSKNNLVFKTGSGNWVRLEDFIDMTDTYPEELFDCYGDFYIESYHQV